MKSLSLTLVVLWLLISGCNQSGDKKSTFEDNHTPFLQLPGSFAIQNSSKTTTELTISWQSSNNTDAYSLFYYRETTPGNQQQIDNVSSPHTITGLIPGESYFVYLRSINRFGYIESNKIKITLDSSGGTPQEFIFSTSPSTSGNTDQILTQQPVIDLVDQNGSRIQSYGATIELLAYSDSTCSTEILNSLENNSSAMVNGRASFTSLKVIKTSIQSIKATDGTYSTECLNGISISPGALASITLSQAPAPVSTTAGSVFTTQPKVTAYDAQNNIIITDSTSTVTLTPYDDVDCNGSSVASGLGGTLTQTLSSGVATFAGIYPQKISVKSIKAGLGALSTCSATLTVAPGAAASANTTISSTSNIVADGTSTATVTITLKDTYQNVISGTTPTVSSTGSNNTISACSSSNTSGISTCTISSTKAEVKTLSITSPASMTATTTSTFVAGALASITLSQAPAPVSTTAGSVFTTQPKVTAYDAQNNIIITDSTSTVTLTPYDDVDCNGSSVASGLGGTLTQTLSSGVATFAGIYPQKISVKSIKAGLGALSTCSATLTVAPGAAASANTTISSTSNIVADGTSTATVTVTLQDAYSNPISGITPTISSTGTANTIDTCTSSNASGSATCLMSSTKAEVKTLAITSPASMTDTTTATFIAGAAAVSKSSIALGAGTANNTASITVTITLKDIYENVIEGTTPSFDIVDGLGTYTIVSPCTATDSSGVSTCTFKTFRGKERIVRVTSPAGLTAVTAKNSLTCSIASFFTLAGSGTSVSPYQISTPQQLDQIRCSGGHYFKLMADIDLAGYEWVTNDYSNNVDIDGNSKTISNLNIDMNLDEYTAAGSVRELASFLGSSGGNSSHFRIIKDLNFSNPIVITSGVRFYTDVNGNIRSDAGHAAVVCGNCIFRFTNIHVTNGRVEGSDWAGGLILQLRTANEGGGIPNQYAELSNSSYQGTVKIPITNASYEAYRWGVGGLIGIVSDGGAIITDNTFEGEVSNAEIDMTTAQPVGGIVGRYASSYDANVVGQQHKIENNTVINSTLKNRTYDIGGIVGYVRNVLPGKQLIIQNNQIINSRLENTCTSHSTHMGGMIGRVLQETDGVSYLNKEVIIRYNSGIDLELYSSYTPGSGGLLSIGGLIGKASGVDVYDNYIQNIDVDMAYSSNYRLLGGLLGSISIYSTGSSDVITRLSRNYVTMSVTAWDPANAEVMGLVGKKSITSGASTYTVDLTSDDNYFDITTSGLSETAPYDNNGLSTTDMQNTTFPGWDDTTIWLFTPNTYPTLR